MIKLYRGDCLDIMPSLPDKSVDMIFVDPPYGQTAQKWDEKLNFNLIWEQYDRIIKENGIIAIFSAQPFTAELIHSNIKNFRYCWYWLKNQGTNFFHAKRMPIRKVEEICIFNGNIYYPQKTTGHIPTNSAKGCSNGVNYHGTNKRNYTGGDTTRFPVNILEYNCVDNYSRLHGNEKPVELLEYFIKTYTLEGETVLDNTMGSGSTGVACVNTNRNFIGIEKDCPKDKDKHFHTAIRRITEAGGRGIEVYE